MKSKCVIFTIFLIIAAAFPAFAQEQNLSAQMADTAMNRVYADSPNGAGIPPKWVYDFGTELAGIKNLWFETGDKKYFDFIKKGVDTFVQNDGAIKTYKIEDYNIDQVNMGRAVLLMYRVTGDLKYKKAADLIRLQLKDQPRANEGGFWHKKIYHEKESPKPNFIEAPHVAAVKDWVKAGGVLVLMGNDFGNCAFDHFNNLAKEFGIVFNKDSKNHVEGNQFEQGKIIIDAGNPIFKAGGKVYLKEISTLNLSGNAESIQMWNGDKVMAVSKFGKGAVFAVGDPWIYNEYTDGRKLPADFQNFQAARALSVWLLKQSR